MWSHCLREEGENCWSPVFFLKKSCEFRKNIWLIFLIFYFFWVCVESGELWNVFVFFPLFQSLKSLDPPVKNPSQATRPRSRASKIALWLTTAKAFSGGRERQTIIGWVTGFSRVYEYMNIYIYMVTPPPMIHLQAFYMGITSVLCTFFLPEKWHSHVSISFTYYVSCRPRHTHTHMQFCFCLLFCHFLRFWSKTQKTLRKPKKPKKPKLQDPCRYKLVS